EAASRADGRGGSTAVAAVYRRGSATASQGTGFTVCVRFETGRAVDAASLLEVAATPCAASGNYTGHFASHAPAFVCDASARRRCGSSVCSGYARPCKYCDDTDVHAYGAGAREAGTSERIPADGATWGG